MKRIFLLIPLLFALLAFAGCSSADDSDISASDLEKAQAIAVIDPSGTTLQTITDQSAIKDFVAALDVDHWELIDLPAGAKEVGQFGLSQEKTIHFGEKDHDDTLYDVAQLTLYDSHTLRARLLSFDYDFDFNLPDDAYEYLAAYFA